MRVQPAGGMTGWLKAEKTRAAEATQVYQFAMVFFEP
jgi:hypothetical protein